MAAVASWEVSVDQALSIFEVPNIIADLVFNGGSIGATFGNQQCVSCVPDYFNISRGFFEGSRFAI